MECLTSETLLRVQLDWKCLLSKKKEGKKKVQRIFFSSPLENIKFRECDSKGNEGGKWKTSWLRELRFCVQPNGIFRSVCNVISHERHTWFTLKFQGRFQIPFNFARSSVGSTHCRLLWKAGSHGGEIKPLPAPLCPVTSSHLMYYLQVLFIMLYVHKL